MYGSGATGASTYFKNFGPRIGFDYSPDFARNTVVRGGYSIYYAPLTYSDFGGNLSSGTTSNPDFQNLDNFIEMGIDLIGQVIKLTPLLTKARRLVGRMQQFAILPLDVVDDAPTVEKHGTSMSVRWCYLTDSSTSGGRS